MGSGRRHERRPRRECGQPGPILGCRAAPGSRLRVSAALLPASSSVSRSPAPLRGELPALKCFGHRYMREIYSPPLRHLIGLRSRPEKNYLLTMALRISLAVPSAAGISADRRSARVARVSIISRAFDEGAVKKLSSVDLGGGARPRASTSAPCKVDAEPAKEVELNSDVSYASYAAASNGRLSRASGPPLPSPFSLLDLSTRPWRVFPLLWASARDHSRRTSLMIDHVTRFTCIVSRSRSLGSTTPL